MASAKAAAAAFQPRQSFEASASIVRSYYLGHHAAALRRIRQGLANVGLIIECRDFRIPITSRNPLFEHALASAPGPRRIPRIVVYTKRDLGPEPKTCKKSSSSSSSSSSGTDPSSTPSPPPCSAQRVQQALRAFHATHDVARAVVFLGSGAAYRREVRGLLAAVRAVAREHAQESLTALRAMVVGMPNTGKSSLLNRLRAEGGAVAKDGGGAAVVARTGAEAGVTRKLGMPVRIVPAETAAAAAAAAAAADLEGVGEGVYVQDTPGVFVPYVADPEAMLKLALVRCTREGLVPDVTLADYLLYHLNRAASAEGEGEKEGEGREGEGMAAPGAARYEYVERYGMAGPTNDVHELLTAVARRTGKLAKGGVPNLEAAATWVLKDWRQGLLGRLVLDDVTPAALERAVEQGNKPVLSLNQARKREKEARKAKREARRLGLGGDDADDDVLL